MVNYDYGVVCIMLSTLGSYVGTLLIQNYLARTKRNSTLVLTLSCVLGFSTIFIPAYTLIQTTQQIEKGINIWDFKSPC
jgi:hypothetical protein